MIALYMPARRRDLWLGCGKKVRAGKKTADDWFN